MIQNVTTLLTMLFLISTIQAQTFTGIWKTIDDTDNVEKSHVEIVERDGKLYGTVIKLLEGATATHCADCEGDLKGAPITGMQILYDLQKDGKAYDDGEILDPASGKTYSCKLELEDANTLKVRGYIGYSWLGRTQYWYRVQ